MIDFSNNTNFKLTNIKINELIAHSLHATKEKKTMNCQTQMFNIHKNFCLSL